MVALVTFAAPTVREVVGGAVDVLIPVALFICLFVGMVVF